MERERSLGVVSGAEERAFPEPREVRHHLRSGARVDTSGTALVRGVPGGVDGALDVRNHESSGTTDGGATESNGGLTAARRGRSLVSCCVGCTRVEKGLLAHTRSAPGVL